MHAMYNFSIILFCIKYKVHFFLKWTRGEIRIRAIMLTESIHQQLQWFLMFLLLAIESFHQQFQWFLLRESVLSTNWVPLLSELALVLAKHDNCNACRLHSPCRRQQKMPHIVCCCSEHCRVCYLEFPFQSHYRLFVYNNTIVQSARPRS